MHLIYRNVNEAFKELVQGIHRGRFPTVKTTSRVGDVLQIPEPVTLTYTKPLERVLFNEARDANPFLGVMESLWMLAGRNTVKELDYFSSKFSSFCSDDGVTANGAYGYRWRHTILKGLKDPNPEIVFSPPGWCQLRVLIQHLKEQPGSRRAVLQMWEPIRDLLRVGNVKYGSDKHSVPVIPGTKDTCCNLSVLFLINDGKLDMTVTNRSNDLVLGSLGANVVHFVFLQEYMASNIGVPVGVYNQFSNNLHVYVSNFKPEEWLADTTPDYYVTERAKPYPLISNPAEFEAELPRFVDLLGPDKVFDVEKFNSPFLRHVAGEALMAFRQHKARDYNAALQHCSMIEAEDWRRVMTTWVRRRQANYNRAKDDGPNHDQTGETNPCLKNAMERMSNGENP